MVPERLHHAAAGLGMLLSAVACGWTVWTLRTSGLARMLGRPAPPPALVLRGPYRFVRYPCCTALLFFWLGIWCWNPGWIAAAGFLVALGGCLVWVAFQEHRRVTRFGEAYRRYRIAVPALLPLRFRRHEQNRAG